MKEENAIDWTWESSCELNELQEIEEGCRGQEKCRQGLPKQT